MVTKDIARVSDVGISDLRRLLALNPDLAIPRDEYNINVTSNDGDRLTPDDLAAQFAAFDGTAAPTHLYFHVPLCNYICHFCNYVKTLVRDDKQTDTLDVWARMLVEESTRYLRRFAWIADARIESFYMGGGTAALFLNDEAALREIVGHARGAYAWASDVEMNIEGNPDNFGREQVALACELGFNRFSLGVQSLDAAVNEFSGRGHTPAQSLEAIDNLRATGMPYNVDMMFGLPLQSIASVQRDFDMLLEREVPTITIYRLRNVDRAAMGIGNRSAWNVPKIRDRLVAEGRFPSLDETYEMRQVIMQKLAGAGYWPSPCGWWSRPGTYPDGNIPQTSKNKWEHYHTMLAHGPGAYGWLSGDREEFHQTHNIADIRAYARFMESEEGLPLAYGRRLSGHRALATALGFNFKANQPIRLQRYREQFGAELLTAEPFAAVFAELLERGFMVYDEADEALRLTLDGEALHEEIIHVFFHRRIGLSDAPVCRR